jgi:hypothetical protein
MSLQTCTFGNRRVEIGYNRAGGQGKMDRTGTEFHANDLNNVLAIGLYKRAQALRYYRDFPPRSP